MLAFLAGLDLYPLHLLRYITLRAGAATATACVFALWFGPAIVSVLLPLLRRGPWARAGWLQWLTRRRAVFLTATIMAALFSAHLTNVYVWLGLAVIIVLAYLGLFDDDPKLAFALVGAAAFGSAVYIAGNAILANYLDMRYVPGLGELAVVCGAIIGAGLPMLWAEERA
jgi:hypothetical protein